MGPRLIIPWLAQQDLYEGQIGELNWYDFSFPGGGWFFLVRGAHDLAAGHR